MKRSFLTLVAALTAAGLMVAGCGQAVPAPPPTQVPAAPTKAAAPATSAPAAPTRAPAEPTKPAAAKVAYPEKGRPITILVGFVAGDANDILARLLGGYLEKDLGAPIQVVNKPGAATQIAMTELAGAKPDGYTLGCTSTMTTVITYLDTDKKAVFNRKSFQPVAVAAVDPMGIYVKSDSPFKTTKDLVDAARAKPGQIKVADNGVMSPTQMVTLALEKSAGVKFAGVHFNGATENFTSVMGGHTDAGTGGPPLVAPRVKEGVVRVLGFASKQPSPFLPEVTTLRSQGYEAIIELSRGLVAPAGVPREAVAALDAAVKKAVADPDFKSRALAAGLGITYTDNAAFAAEWDELDKQVAPMLAEIKKEQAQK